jgi:hypothetical protein
MHISSDGFGKFGVLVFYIFLQSLQRFVGGILLFLRGFWRISELFSSFHILAFYRDFSLPNEGVSEIGAIMGM